MMQKNTSTPLSITILILLLIGPDLLSAQVFQLKTEVDSLKILPTNPIVGDITQDGCYDLMANASFQNGNSTITLITNRENFEFDTLTIRLQSNLEQAIHRIDIDHDNDLDLFTIANNPLDNTSYAIAFKNQGNGQFSIDTLGQASFKISNVAFVDFNNDGTKELLAIKEDESLLLYDISLNHIMNIMPDDVPLLATINYEVSDFNNDSWLDIFIQIRQPDSSYQAGILYNRDTLGFSYEPVQKFEAPFESITKGDIDQNGFDDLLIVENEDLKIHSAGLLMNSGTDFSFKPIVLPALNAASYFIADFNSDGQSDISIYGETSNHTANHYLMLLNQDVENEIYIAQIDTMQLDTIGYFHNTADWDVDGDLDLSFWNKHNGKIQFFENTTATINEAAAPTINPVVFMGKDEIVIVWEATSDDHTPSKAITYDLSLFMHPEQQLVSTGFDNSSGNRFFPDYGYYGHNEIAYIKDPPLGNYTLVIQSIDNALYVGGKGSGGDCTLSFEVCENINHQDIFVCNEAPVLLDFKEAIDPGIPVWYSINQGFLSYHDVLNYQLEGDNDVVYAGIPGSINCDFKTFNIHRVELEIPDLPADTLICDQASLAIRMTIDYDSVLWINPMNQLIAKGKEFSFAPTGLLRDTIILKAFQQTCEITDTMTVGVSIPDIIASPKSSVINGGASVQLQAVGGETYEWLPPTWLNASDVNNPIAEPNSSIEYIVIGMDIYGCQDADTLFIEVENISFAPNLFSPNNDGRNERFKLLNLSEAEDFLWVIFDRNGKKIFETSDTSTATSVGWDGTKNGTPVPQGVYFWRVRGEYLDGNPVLVNGKKQGVINLLR